MHNLSELKEAELKKETKNIELKIREAMSNGQHTTTYPLLNPNIVGELESAGYKFKVDGKWITIEIE